ncbi:hypothetical protein [Cupriavidus gilardii]|uniref:hypothetical protein n=1 Tax=Cupriavidus gilardii TaxID=82541 RepID=UPI0021B28B9A|nr:hypothetical protein [Cupriavidus gilardii]UXC37175.1 hypothetical protein N4G38_06940 [Cupriavidus gilardii]
MDDKQMREAFHQYAEARGWDIEHCEGMYRIFETQIQWMGWKAAYVAGQRSQGRRDAYNKGVAAGMERAAGICEGMPCPVKDAALVVGERGRVSLNSKAYANAIRAEIKGDRNA